MAISQPVGALVFPRTCCGRSAIRQITLLPPVLWSPPPAAAHFVWGDVRSESFHLPAEGVDQVIRQIEPPCRISRAMRTGSPTRPCLQAISKTPMVPTTGTPILDPPCPALIDDQPGLPLQSDGHSGSLTRIQSRRQDPHDTVGCRRDHRRPMVNSAGLEPNGLRNEHGAQDVDRQVGGPDPRQGDDGGWRH